MPSDRTERTDHVLTRGRSSSSREARRRKLNYRLAIVAYLLVWVTVGIALGWPSTEQCLENQADSGVLDAATVCLPVPALDLLLWSMTGTAIGLVVYYVLRRQR